MRRLSQLPSSGSPPPAGHRRLYLEEEEGWWGWAGVGGGRGQGGVERGSSHFGAIAGSS